MRAVLISIAVVMVCLWAGFELRQRMPAVSIALFTLAALLAMLAIGAGFQLY